MPLKIAVVGAGVFGCAAALELATRGHAVALIDPGPLPHPNAASNDMSKLVRVDYGNDLFYTELGELALEGFRRWNRDWPEPLFHETGCAIATSGSLDEFGFESDSFRTLSARGYALRRFSALHEFSPDRIADGYVNPVGGWAESGRITAKLSELARAAGVSIENRTAALEGLAAERVLVCTGAWTHVLVPELADRIRAVGQPVFHLAPSDPERFRAPRFLPWAHDIAKTGWYGFSANPDGIVKIANHGPGTPIDPRAERSVSAADEARLHDFLARTIPALADAPIVGRRLCLYSDTFDGDFLIDQHPDRPGLFVAAGGSGHAFKFAPVLGPLIADVVERRENRFAGRFAWRAPAPRRTESARCEE